MASRKRNNAGDFIVPLNMNGLRGRMLRLPTPSKKKREILLIYGVHASLERMFGIAEEFNRYGGVTIPDLPGFGGMSSFYKLDEKPTLDNMADYLAAFVKLRYRGQHFTVMGMSYGFVVVTRMLQRYPEIAANVDLLVSLVGFVHKDDFKVKRSTSWLVHGLASVFNHRFPAWFGRNFLLKGYLIKAAYTLVADRHNKFKDVDKTERQKRLVFETGLWRDNDLRTYTQAILTMAKLDLCHQRVNLPVYHVAVDGDHYFDHYVVEQHMRVIFNDFEVLSTSLSGHAPSVVADAATVAPYVPQKLRRLLNGKLKP